MNFLYESLMSLRISFHKCPYVLEMPFCSLQIGFDAFSLRHAASWRNVMDWFHREVTAIENEARHFIDDSFKTLRSAEGAFDMLLNFRHIRSREAINSQMMKKFNDILVQFGKEV